MTQRSGRDCTGRGGAVQCPVVIFWLDELKRSRVTFRQSNTRICAAKGLLDSNRFEENDRFETLP